MSKTNVQNRLTAGQTREMQKYLLGILLAIDKVCREHNLRYYLVAGTMLGAVRHKGFIPWDDDADIALPRKDYDVLVEHAHEWLPGRYELVSYKQNPMYPYAFARIQDADTTYILRRHFDFVGGLPIDVFPLDGMTPNRLKQHWHFFRNSMAKKMLYFATVDPYKHGHGIKSLLPLLMHRIVSQSWAHRKIVQIQSEYDYDKYPLVVDHDFKPDRGIHPKETYGTPSPIEFEGHQLLTAQNTDDYLTRCYGDYMTPPAKEEYPPQNFRLLDLNKPYCEYMKEQEKKELE